MKTITYYSAILLMSLSVTCCAQSSGKKGINGNGNVTTQTINTASYNEIKVIGSLDVTLVKGDEGAITVTTDENLQEYVKITSDNGILTITLSNNTGWIKTKKGINVLVPFRDLTAISLIGSGDVISKDLIEAGELEIALNGSGALSLEIDTQRLDAKLTGSGDAVVKGKTTHFEVKVSGSGDFNAARLKSEHTEVYVSGSGEAEVYASKSMKARVNGSGDITYSGNPEKVDSKISGSGDIEGRN